MDTGRQHWYAIHTKPKQEDRAESNLRSWGIETFAPRVKKRPHASNAGEKACTISPLFPRYIFARFDAERLLHKVNFTRGVDNVVSFGGEAAPVDDEIIEFIRSQAAEDGLIRLGEELRYGDAVKIKDGPFNSLTGIFQRGTKESERVMILLTAVKYQGCVLVDRAAVEKVDLRPLNPSASVGLAW